MYKIIIKLKKSEKMKGGIGDNRPDNDFDEEQLKNGIKVEMEHTNNPKIAQEIAMDHLTEDPKYYDYLEEMESKYSVKIKTIPMTKDWKERYQRL